MNPLTRAEGDSINSPIDPEFEGRYYVDPECKGAEDSEALPDGAQDGYVINMQYQLPQGLTCEHCVLQMVYCEFDQLGSARYRVRPLTCLTSRTKKNVVGSSKS